MIKKRPPDQYVVVNGGALSAFGEKHYPSLNQVNFWSETQKDTNLLGTKLATAKLIRANLGSANLCVVEFYQSDLSGADLIISVFEFAYLVVKIHGDKLT